LFCDAEDLHLNLFFLDSSHISEAYSQLQFGQNLHISL
jgi:hypothetical protein